MILVEVVYNSEVWIEIKSSTHSSTKIGNNNSLFQRQIVFTRFPYKFISSIENLC